MKVKVPEDLMVTRTAHVKDKLVDLNETQYLIFLISAIQDIELPRPVNVSHEILCPARIAHCSGQGNGHDRGAAQHMFCAREPLGPHPSSSLLDLTWPTGKG